MNVYYNLAQLLHGEGYRQAENNTNELPNIIFFRKKIIIMEE